MKSYKKNREAEMLMNQFVGRALAVALNKNDSPDNILDTLMDVEKDCCKVCGYAACTGNYSCKNCRFKAQLNRIVNNILDANEAQA